MELSKTHFESSLPYWQDYLPFLRQFAGRGFPTCEQLNALLPHDLNSEGGYSIRFVASTDLEEGPYEQRIYSTGQVSTRPDNWHDLFNALVWARFPNIKQTMNTLHYHAEHRHEGQGRGPLRDALTLFDECGVIVFSNQSETLESIRQHRWKDTFVDNREQWGIEVDVAISGHAMLEKLMSPYKSMTAKALLVQVSDGFMLLPREEKLKALDTEISAGMRAGKLVAQPASLSPLPLAGIPGWWIDEQDLQFYADTGVFRP